MIEDLWRDKWSRFKSELPHQQLPFSKKNWGNANHSLCSYQGKLKPSIAHHLVNTFVPNSGTVFDPFCGVGTIPFEAAINGRMAYGMDISVMAFFIAQAKIGLTDESASIEYINRLSDFISSFSLPDGYVELHGEFGLNKKLIDYYHRDTFCEVLKAREFFLTHPPRTASEMVVIAAMLHILHGNRPYVLSRKSHPITPYAPTGEFEYRNVIEKLTNKVLKYYGEDVPADFVAGKIFLQDSTQSWPEEIENIDAIITSPPFFDSTRFYSSNWIRLWFSGWNRETFHMEPSRYVDEIQKKDLGIYSVIFSQSCERLKPDGVMIMHLGKSSKCDMGNALLKISSKYFCHQELFNENVAHCARFGMKNLGTVTDHQYLVMWNQ